MPIHDYSYSQYGELKRNRQESRTNQFQLKTAKSMWRQSDHNRIMQYEDPIQISAQQLSEFLYHDPDQVKEDQDRVKLVKIQNHMRLESFEKGGSIVSGHSQHLSPFRQTGKPNPSVNKAGLVQFINSPNHKLSQVEPKEESSGVQLLEVIYEQKYSKVSPHIKIELPTTLKGSPLKHLQQQTTQFLQDCSFKFNLKDTLKHIFLPDGTPIFSLDEIPLGTKSIIVSQMPQLQRKIGAQGITNKMNTSMNQSFADSQYERTSTAGSLAKSYLKDIMAKQRQGLDKVKLKNELNKYGKDLLQDSTFYDGMSASTNQKLHNLFKNNTYLETEVDQKLSQFSVEQESLDHTRRQRTAIIKFRRDLVRQDPTLSSAAKQRRYKINGVELRSVQPLTFPQQSHDFENLISTEKADRFGEFDVIGENMNEHFESRLDSIQEPSQHLQPNNPNQPRKIKTQNLDKKPIAQLEVPILSKLMNPLNLVAQISSEHDDEKRKKSIETNNSRNHQSMTRGNNLTIGDGVQYTNSSDGKISSRSQNSQKSKRSVSKGTLQKHEGFNEQFRLSKKLSEANKQLILEKSRQSKSSSDDSGADENQQKSLKKYAKIMQQLLDKERKNQVMSKVALNLKRLALRSQDGKSGILGLTGILKEGMTRRFSSTSDPNGTALDLSSIGTALMKQTTAKFANQSEAIQKVKFISKRDDMVSPRNGNSFDDAKDHTSSVFNPQATMTRISRQHVQDYLSRLPGFKRGLIQCKKGKGNQKKKDSESKNFIEENIKRVNKKDILDTDDKFLMKLNIPQLQLECSFKRQELYAIYTKFKALAKISSRLFETLLGTKIGVERSVFMDGMKELSLDNTEFLERIFDSVDSGGKTFVTWEEYFQAIKLVSSKNLKDKIDLFFKIVDANGDGVFDYDEIREICKLSLSKVDCSETNYEDFLEETSDFYAGYIFKLLGKTTDDEIPCEEFKEAALYGTQDQREVLCMFCCADANMQEQYEEESDSGIERKHKVEVEIEKMD